MIFLGILSMFKFYSYPPWLKRVTVSSLMLIQYWESTVYHILAIKTNHYITLAIYCEMLVSDVFIHDNELFNGFRHLEMGQVTMDYNRW